MSDNTENTENTEVKAPKKVKTPKAPKEPWTPPSDAQEIVDSMFKLAASGDKKVMAFIARQALDARDEAKRIRNLAATQEIVGDSDA